MKPSKLRYKEAVDAARKLVYGQISRMPEHFDERQKRIFNKYVLQVSHQKAVFEEIDNDLWVAYTGQTRQEYLQQIKESLECNK